MFLSDSKYVTVYLYPLQSQTWSDWSRLRVPARPSSHNCNVLSNVENPIKNLKNAERILFTLPYNNYIRPDQCQTNLFSLPILHVKKLSFLEKLQSIFRIPDEPKLL